MTDALPRTRRRNIMQPRPACGDRRGERGYGRRQIGLWEGITLSYDAVAGGIAESTYFLDPGADPGQIRLQYNVPTEIDEAGELVMNFETGQMRGSAPVAWQDVVYAHIKSLMPDDPRPDDPVFLGGGSRPNSRFRELCVLAGIEAKTDVETGAERLWMLKDQRMTCATYYDEHMPESSVEILGHAVGGITYRHYAHRAPLAFEAIMTLPQPSAFTALARGFDGECPCCRRRFADAP